jgi:arylsulfatase A-like enzyme
VKKAAAAVLALTLLPVLLLWLVSHRRYNVILITVDTLRADYLSAYNPDAASTPNIDRIARTSVLFSQSRSTIPITLAAHASILTSHGPKELGLFNNGDVFDHRFPLLSELLEKEGYHTAAFVSLGVLKSGFGLNKGFGEYEDDFKKCNGRYYKFASEVNHHALPWMQKEQDHPFFAWIHYSDPHGPYVTADAPPETEAIINGTLTERFCLAKREKYRLDFVAQPGTNTVEFRAIIDPRVRQKDRDEASERYLDKNITTKRGSGIEFRFGQGFQDIKLPSGPEAHYFEGQAILSVINSTSQPVRVQARFSGGARQLRSEILANYASEVRYVDRHIGELWDKLGELGLQDKTILVLTADHGEGLYTHGSLGHVDCLYDEVAHVPLIIHYPWLGHRGTVASDPVCHLDLVPTILDLLQMSTRNLGLQGQSLRRVVSWSPIDKLLSTAPGRERIFVSTFTPEAPWNSFAMVDGTWKLIYTPERTRRQWEAYDLSRDPLERRDIAGFDNARFESEQFSGLRKILVDYSQEAEQAHDHKSNPRLDEEQKKMLRDLGYVAGHE